MYRVADSLIKYNGVYTVNYENKYGVSLDNKEENKTYNDNELIKCTENIVEVKCKEIVEELDSIEETALYKELKEYRLNKSREEKIKPYFLYNNLQLEAIIRAKPKTVEELKEINGFGNVKCEKYGADIIEIIKKALWWKQVSNIC